MKQAGRILDLSQSPNIGSGRDRSCYQHPDDPSKCIKISIVKNDKQSRREPRYYKKLQKQKIPWDHIARFHGTCGTNLGKGLIFDLVRDGEGDVSKSLNHYLAKQGINQNELDQLMTELKSYLTNYRILTRDISPNNLLVQKSRMGMKIIIIDGLGNSELVPLSTYFSPFARRFISRKWKNLLRRIAKAHPGYDVSKL